MKSDAMTSFRYPRTIKRLDDDLLPDLFQLLGINGDSVDLSMFKQLPADNQTFYYFANHALSIQGHCFIMAFTGWKPENIFYQLSRVVKTHNITLTSASLSSQYEAYEIDFVIDGNHAHIIADRDDPSTLFHAINTHLGDFEFVRMQSHYAYRHKIEWLLLPKGFDAKKLKDLTGCSEVKGSWQPSHTIRHSPDPDPQVSRVQPLERKIFFIPVIFTLVGGVVADIRYSSSLSGEQAIWAGRVLPGQTVTEGIATELKKELDYTGAFDFYNFRFLDYKQDKSGKQIERYTFALRLHEPVIATVTGGGLTVHHIEKPSRSL